MDGAGLGPSPAHRLGDGLGLSHPPSASSSSPPCPSPPFLPLFDSDTDERGVGNAVVAVLEDLNPPSPPLPRPPGPSLSPRFEATGLGRGVKDEDSRSGSSHSDSSRPRPDRARSERLPSARRRRGARCDRSRRATASLLSRLLSRRLLLGPLERVVVPDGHTAIWKQVNGE